ncbi:MAG: hypothetical protein WD157_01910 [Patescibacteria group bacterium]
MATENEMHINTTKKVLAFDADGVIVDFFQPFSRFVGESIGREILISELADQNFAKYFGIPPSQIKEIHYNFMWHGHYENLPAIPGAIEALKKLIAVHDVQIVTGRIGGLVDVTKRWFNNHGLPLVIHHTSAKDNPVNSGENQRSKLQCCKSIGASCLVEDNLHEFRDWDLAIKPIGFPCPWNAMLRVEMPHVEPMDWPKILDYYID